MTASSNFGNMFSVLAASAFLPFLPMMPVQILLLNLIYDVSCLAVPWDNVDEDYLRVPRAWDASSISKFMVWIGPTAGVRHHDVPRNVFPAVPDGVWRGVPHRLAKRRRRALSRCSMRVGLMESLWTQTLVIHMIRTPAYTVYKEPRLVAFAAHIHPDCPCARVIPYDRGARAWDDGDARQLFSCCCSLRVIAYGRS